MLAHRQGYVWRADIAKFFDNVNQATLRRILRKRVACPDALWLIDLVLSSYYKTTAGVGMPIGNLTSQILANVYLNEFDRFMVHKLKPSAYLRYGDDWLCFADNLASLEKIQSEAIHFLEHSLGLTISAKLNKIVPTYRGVTYLGVDLWPGNKRLTSKTLHRIDRKLNEENFASYEALLSHFTNSKTIKYFYWGNVES
jgi:retron-type reverse transcriptase